MDKASKTHAMCIWVRINRNGHKPSDSVLNPCLQVDPSAPSSALRKWVLGTVPQSLSDFYKKAKIAGTVMKSMGFCLFFEAMSQIAQASLKLSM